MSFARVIDLLATSRAAFRGTNCGLGFAVVCPSSWLVLCSEDDGTVVAWDTETGVRRATLVHSSAEHESDSNAIAQGSEEKETI